MRRSEYKKYHDQFQEHDESFSQDRPQPARRNNNRGNEQYPNYEKKTYHNKYANNTRNKFDQILNPNPQPHKNARQDYDFRKPPEPKERSVYGGNNQKPYRNNFSRNDPKIEIEKLDEQLDNYKRRQQDYPRHQNRNNYDRNTIARNSTKFEDNRDDDANSSFIIQKPASEMKRQNRHDNRHDQSFKISKEVDKKVVQIDDDDDWLRDQKSTQVQRKIQIERDPVRQQRKQIKRQQQKRQFYNKQASSPTNSLNQAFNNNSQQSINNSSIWCQQKILQDLNLSQNSQINNSTISNASESYVSSIRQKSQIYDINSSSIINNQNTHEIQMNKLDLIHDQIDRSKDINFINVEVSIKNTKNIMQAIIKEIEVVKLNIKVELAVKQEGIIVKNKDIQFQKLTQYIQLQQINVFYPKIYDPNPVTSKFIFCRIKAIFPQNQQVKNVSKFIKKQKKKTKPSLDCSFLIRINKLQLKCMNCQKYNQVPIINQTKLASLSCRNCNQQMIAEITSISREQ